MLDQAQSYLALGLIFGILFIWFGAVVAMVSLPLARGEVNARTYNYRPWRPGFVKRLTDQQVNEIGRRQARWAIACGVMMMVIGVEAMVFGLVPGLGGYLWVLIAIPLFTFVVLIILSYYQAYRVAKAKPDENKL